MNIYKTAYLSLMFVTMFLNAAIIHAALLDVVINEFTAELVLESPDQVMSSPIFSQKFEGDTVGSEQYVQQIDWNQYFDSTSSTLIVPMIQWDVEENQNPNADPQYDLIKYNLEVRDGSTGELLFSSSRPGFPNFLYQGRSNFAYAINNPGSYILKFQLYGDIVYENPNNTQIDVILKEIQLTLTVPEYGPDFETCEKLIPAQLPPLNQTDPVRYHSGEFYQDETDLRIKGRGMDFVWGRQFRNFFGKKTNQGNKWDFSYNIYLTPTSDPTKFTLHDGKNRSELYELDVQTPEFFRVLKQEANGSLTLHFPDKKQWKFHDFDSGNLSGRIYEIADRNNNAIQFTYSQDGKLSKITDTLGRDIDIFYYQDGPNEGKIEFIRDFDNRIVYYQYYETDTTDGLTGDLFSVTSPSVTLSPNDQNNFPDGKIRYYKYYTQAPLRGYLKSITDGKGKTYVTNYYGERNQNLGKVVRQVWGETGEEIHIHYQYLPEEDTNKLRVTVNDRNGNITEYFYNDQNVITKFYEYEESVASALSIPPNAHDTDGQNWPLDGSNNPLEPIVTTYEWDPVHSLLLQANLPEQNTVTYEYTGGIDPLAAGNLKNITYTAPNAETIIQEYQYNGNFGGGCCFNFVTRITDGEGRIIAIEYDDDGPGGASLGNPEKIIQVLEMNELGQVTKGIVTEVEYNSFGQITAVIHPQNPIGYRRRDVFEYYTASDGFKNGYLKSITIDSAGESLITLFNVDQFGNVISITDPRGNVSTYHYNELDQVYQVDKPQVDLDLSGLISAQYTVQYFYDANNNLVQIDEDNIDEAGNPASNPKITTTLDYDILNYVTQISHEINASENAVTTIEYDPNRNIKAIALGEANRLNAQGNPIQPANRIERFYNGRNLLRAVMAGAGDTQQSETTLLYDGNKNLSKVIHGSNYASNEHIFYYLYDGFDRLAHAIDPMANVKVYMYDKSHNITHIQNYGEWNDHANIINEQDLWNVYNIPENALLYEMQYDFDAANRIRTVSQSYFDQNGPILRDHNQDGVVVTELEYGFNGQSPLVEERKDDRGNTVNFSYDSVNRLASITDAKGNARLYHYDANSNIQSVTETDVSDLGSPAETFGTHFVYDELNRLLQLTDPVGSAFQYAYDSRNNMVLFTDALNVKTKNTYDGLNRLTAVTRALGSTDEITIAQEWDHTSRLISQIDGNNNKTQYGYDPLNRLISLTYADGEEFNYTYDAHHNVDTSTDPNGSSVDYDYDKRDRLTLKTVTPGSGVSNDTTTESFGYDGLGRLISAVDDDSAVTFAYDSLSNVLSETLSVDGAAALVTSATYDGLGNLLQANYPGGRRITYQYDPLNRIKTIREGFNTLTSYDYIGRGRVERKSFLNGVQSLYGYDGLRRVIDIKHTNSTETLLEQAFNWDAMSNKTARSVNGVTEIYTYDNLYRLNSFNYDDVGNRIDPGYDIGSSGSDTFKMNEYVNTPFANLTYDANGNLITQATHTLTYDYRNRMVGFNDGTVTTYQYDALGRRIAKTVDGTETRYYALGSRVIEETTATNNTSASYVYGNYIDEVLSMNRSNNDYFYHSDDIYNVMMLSNAVGGMAEDYEYDAFGAPDNVSSVGNPYLFNGRRFDDESSLYYYRTRYLDPSVGRFTTRDSIGIWGDPSNLGNGYTYVANNPQTFVDPFGLSISGVYFLQNLKENLEPEGEELFWDTVNPFTTEKDIDNLRQSFENFANSDDHSLVNYLYEVGPSGLTIVCKIIFPPLSLRGPKSSTNPNVGYHSPIQSPFESNFINNNTANTTTGKNSLTGKIEDCIPCGNERFSMGAASRNSDEFGKTFADILTDGEIKEFTLLQDKYPDWMPDLYDYATLPSQDKLSTARNQVIGRGHHRHPLAFGGEPNPNMGLKPTGETLYNKNPIHTEITNFFNRVLRRLRSKGY